ncbi:MAG: alpha/beta hydrolase-fold protein [Lentisphaeria bacterium]|nr:alpha/beta hydrolase-fold protein [Lentisphaeria bacterium]
MRKILGLSAMAGTVLSAQLLAATVTDIQAVYRHGQVFLTWQEKDLPAAAELSVFSSEQPITQDNLAEAQVLATRVHKSSARDWWQDPAAFAKDAEAAAPAGYVIAPGRPPLDPHSGLHVHTVPADELGPRYYAVTWSSTGNQASRQTIVPGVNSTTRPCVIRTEQVQPIWQKDSPAPQRNCARGKALILSLHGRGGGVTARSEGGASATDCLWFKSAEQGWREGLTGRFALRITGDAVIISPMDREWVNRPVLESPDSRDHCPAINTWWYGYNENIAVSTRSERIVVRDVTHQYLLALIQWAQNWLGTDPQQTYVSGGSMGGSGAITLALKYPQLFAAVYAQVPVYAYTWDGCSTSKSLTAARLVCNCGPIKDTPAFTADGKYLLQALDNRLNIAAAHDTPPIFATNGRKDGSIPWVNNPSFYQAANAARQGFAVFWNDGDHGMSSQAPDDVKAWSQLIRRYRLDRSYPAFSNCSDARAFGNGDPSDGDRIGWINRGFSWELLRDSPANYAIAIKVAHPELSYPVQVDVTLRRRQAFKPAAGNKLLLKLGDKAPAPYTMPTDGLLTIPAVSIASPEGVVIELSH